MVTAVWNRACTTFSSQFKNMLITYPWGPWCLNATYNRAPALAALLLPLSAFNKAKIKRLTGAITLKVMFPPSVPRNDTGNINSMRIFHSVGLIFKFQQLQKCLHNVSELWDFLLDTMPVTLAFHPSLPPFQPNLLVFNFFPVLSLNFPNVPFKPSHSPQTAIRSSFFPHSSNIPQLFWSLKSEEFKDPALIFLSV